MRAFIIRGFGVKKDSAGVAVDFDRVERELIRPAMVQCGLAGGTTGEVVDAGSIHADMFALILEADVVICDITVHNANVFYELGVRHALRKKHTVLIKGDPSADVTPFDLSGDRYLTYATAAPADAVPRLVAAIQAGMSSVRPTDSPIFQLLPALPEADASDITVVPLDFIEEVQRAEAACDKGWLRLLADDVRGERFQWDGLRAIARAQWSLKDYAGAKETWETIRRTLQNDLEAQLALANIYERLYRARRQPALLEASNQTIRAVLDAEELAPKYRAEALALHGRNLKTLWRLDFEELPTLDQRRAGALRKKLRQSYDAYRNAFDVDLNNFYPGVSAYQMGSILKALSDLPAWRNLFANPREADRYRETLDEDLTLLRYTVTASVAAARKRTDGDDLMWADISMADLAFLATADDDAPAGESLAAAYADAIPRNKRFAWDATRGQLELFAALGIGPNLTKMVIEAVDGQVPASVPAAAARRAHLVVFSGHRVDGVGAGLPARFPAGAEMKARGLIEAQLRALQADGEDIVVLASAAPGADILAHEACAALKVASRLCLPMPARVVAREVFKSYDAWLPRFYAIVQTAGEQALVLQDELELPRWLRAKAADPWERGNRWVMNLAQSWGADRLTLLVLWDGDSTQSAAGGTAQMVQLARDTGVFSGIIAIDTKALGEAAAAPASA